MYFNIYYTFFEKITSPFLNFPMAPALCMTDFQHFLQSKGIPASALHIGIYSSTPNNAFIFTLCSSESVIERFAVTSINVPHSE